MLSDYFRHQPPHPFFILFLNSISSQLLSYRKHEDCTIYHSQHYTPIGVVLFQLLAPIISFLFCIGFTTWVFNL